jgi:hypothetical protein
VKAFSGATGDMLERSGKAFADRIERIRSLLRPFVEAAGESMELELRKHPAPSLVDRERIARHLTTKTAQALLCVDDEPSKGAVRHAGRFAGVAAVREVLNPHPTGDVP